MALAPRVALFGVPSRSSISWSTRRWSPASRPTTRCAICDSTACTACWVPLPPYRSPPSRSSTASKAPVDAPEGTAARPKLSSSRITSTSTVGLPRESRISRAMTSSMAANALLLAGSCAGDERSPAYRGDSPIPGSTRLPVACTCSAVERALEEGAQVGLERRLRDGHVDARHLAPHAVAERVGMGRGVGERGQPVAAEQVTPPGGVLVGQVVEPERALAGQPCEAAGAAGRPPRAPARG